MSTVPSYKKTDQGDELPPVRVVVGREQLVRYAGASGDFNPIHWSSRSAASLGLPDVIAHGMLTMAQASRVLTGWLGDPARIVEYSARFTKPVVVPDDGEGTEVRYTGVVAAKLDDNLVRIDLTGMCGDDKVLGAARAIVRLDD